MVKKTGPWSTEEDALLTSLVGPSAPTSKLSWNDVEQQFKGTRTANQLRHRWHDVLKVGGKRWKPTTVSSSRNNVTPAPSTRRAQIPPCQVAAPKTPKSKASPMVSQKRSVGRPRFRFTEEEDTLLLQLRDVVGMEFEEMEIHYFPKMKKGAVEERWKRLQNLASKVAAASRARGSSKTVLATMESASEKSTDADSDDEEAGRVLFSMSRSASVAFDEDRDAEDSFPLSKARTLLAPDQQDSNSSRQRHSALSTSPLTPSASSNSNISNTVTPNWPLSMLASIAPSPIHRPPPANRQWASPIKRKYDDISSPETANTVLTLPETTSLQTIATRLFGTPPPSTRNFSAPTPSRGRSHAQTLASRSTTGSTSSFFSDGGRDEVKGEGEKWLPFAVAPRSPLLSPVQESGSQRTQGW